MGRSLLKVLLASGCCALAALAVQEVVPGIPGLALAIVGAAGVYGLALRVLRAVPKADVKVMEGFIARLPSWLAAPLDAVLLMLTGIPKEAE